MAIAQVFNSKMRLSGMYRRFEFQIPSTQVLLHAVRHHFNNSNTFFGIIQRMNI